MKSSADLTRLREIAAQQATLIYRLTKLKQEEDAILAKYDESVPDCMRISRVGRPRDIPMSDQERRRRKYEREKQREAYFQPVGDDD